MIITRYHGPTNHKGPRISATGAQGRVYAHWDDGLTPPRNHDRAFRCYCKRFGVTRPHVSGETPDTRGYAYVPLLDWRIVYPVESLPPEQKLGGLPVEQPADPRRE